MRDTLRTRTRSFQALRRNNTMLRLHKLLAIVAAATAVWAAVLTRVVGDTRTALLLVGA